MRHTDGVWDTNEKGVYFLACTNGNLSLTTYNDFLIALNEIKGERTVLKIREACGKGKVLIDSGVHELAAREHRRTGDSFATIFSRDPFEIEGFNAWIEKYTVIMNELKDVVWGYIEIDLGGPVGKRKIRAMLEDSGLRPIPVYHPLIDNYEYLDELFDQYDRICVGNLADRPYEIRREILLTIKKRNTKNRFVHLLGYTPDELMWGMGFDSSDSSTWVQGPRWGFIQEKASFNTFSRVEDDIVPIRGQENDGMNWKSTELSALFSSMQMKGYRSWQEAQVKLGLV